MYKERHASTEESIVVCGMKKKNKYIFMNYYITLLLYIPIKCVLEKYE